MKRHSLQCNLWIRCAEHATFPTSHFRIRKHVNVINNSSVYRSLLSRWSLSIAHRTRRHLRGIELPSRVSSLRDKLINEPVDSSTSSLLYNCCRIRFYSFDAIAEKVLYSNGQNKETNGLFTALKSEWIFSLMTSRSCC